MEFVPISEAELKDVIANLKEKADQLLTRIERLQLEEQQGPMTNQPR